MTENNQPGIGMQPQTTGGQIEADAQGPIPHEDPGKPKNLKINGSVAGQGIQPVVNASGDKVTQAEVSSNRKNLVIVIVLGVLFAVFLAIMTYLISR